MNRFLALFTVGLGLCALTGGCRSSHGGAPPAAVQSIREVKITEVAQILKEKNGVVVDANGEETRREFGVIPGALLLTSHKDYSLSELPQDKSTNLVFYCGGTQCRASDAAAGRAAGSGYSHVSVLRDGIRGWKSAGQATETPRS
jgi:rhodanese-related sulfurtransferase